MTDKNVKKTQKNSVLPKEDIQLYRLGTMKMGPEKSEVLVLGVSDGSGGTIPLTTEKRVDNGECVF